MNPPEPGRTCWRIDQATQATVIVDAEPYFRYARAAMMKAKRRIMLIGWDFDARITLVRQDEADDGAPVTIGDYIGWLVERTPELEIFLLRWDVGALKSMVRPSTLVTTLRWMAHPRITVKLDGHHPPAGSHHQKIVVIDDCFAFCGGIDMTADRWDTRHHRDEEPSRSHPDGSLYGPWHDVTTALSGPVAAALGKHARAMEGGRRRRAKPCRRHFRLLARHPARAVSQRRHRDLSQRTGDGRSGAADRDRAALS